MAVLLCAAACLYFHMGRLCCPYLSLISPSFCTFRSWHFLDNFIYILMLSPSNGNQANIIEAFKSQPQSGPTGSCNFIKIKGGSIKPDCHYVTVDSRYLGLAYFE